MSEFGQRSNTQDVVTVGVFVCSNHTPTTYSFVIFWFFFDGIAKHGMAVDC